MSQIISVLGALIILGAYAATQNEKFATRKITLALFNVCGGLMLATSAVIEKQPGVILLEGSWALISGYSATRLWRARRQPK